MPRNKTAKRSSKRGTVKNSMSHYQTIEKEFMGIPGKFASQVKKDIQTHKQKENKLKAAWNKSKKAVKTAETRVKAATKNKTTVAGKKTWNTSKKAYAEAVSHHSGLKKQMTEMSDVVGTLVAKHAKLSALSKNLTQFNRDWTKQAKTALATKATKKTKTKRKTRTVKSQTTTTSPQQHDQYETPENVYGEENVGETTESNN